MKRFGFLLIGISLMLSLASHAHDSLKMKIEKLGSELGLTASQRTSMETYANDMYNEFVKDHHEAEAKLQKILSTDQFEKLMYHMKAMPAHHQPRPRNDDEVKTMVERYSDYLLLTANQEQEFLVVALTFHHKEMQLKEALFARLGKILTKEQLNKLNNIKSNW